jgi:hypothetical protein
VKSKKLDAHIDAQIPYKQSFYFIRQNQQFSSTGIVPFFFGHLLEPLLSNGCSVFSPLTKSAKQQMGVTADWNVKCQLEVLTVSRMLQFNNSN